MANQLIYPLINGTGYDFSSIELSLAGQKFAGFKSIDYERTRDQGEGRGNSPDPLFKTKGENKYSGSVELFLAEWNYLHKNILIPAAALQGVANTGEGWGDVLFTVTVQYYNVGMDPITDILIGCNANGPTASQSRGVDPLMRKIDLKPLKIRFGNTDDLGTSLQNYGG